MARVAIVEDNKHVRRFMETLLKLRGHEVTTFENGELALGPALEGGFDLVISDVQMPQRDGISLCTELRKRFSKTFCSKCVRVGPSLSSMLGSARWRRSVKSTFTQPAAPTRQASASARTSQEGRGITSRLLPA